MIDFSKLIEEIRFRYNLETPPYKRGPALPKCSLCGSGVMVERVVKATGKTFMGCSNFPSCRNTSFNNKYK